MPRLLMQTVSKADEMITPEKLQQLLINASFKRRHGKHCAVCGRTGSIAVHHIKPRRRGGSNGDHNLVCLCHTHHKLADRVTLNWFWKFEVFCELTTREELVAFIRLIEQSSAQQKCCRAVREERHERQIAA